MSRRIFLSSVAIAILVAMPASAQLNFRDGFESGDFSAWKATGGGPTLNGVSITNTESATGSYAAKIEPLGDRVNYVGLNVNQLLSDIWVKFRIKFPVGYSFTPSSGGDFYKLVIVDGAVFNNQRYFININGGEFMLLNENAHDQGWLRTGLKAQADGQWHQIEWHVKIASGIQAGAMEFWYDGVKRELGCAYKGDCANNFTTCNQPCGAVTNVLMGAYSNYATATYRGFYIDDVTISSSRSTDGGSTQLGTPGKPILVPGP